MDSCREFDSIINNPTSFLSSCTENTSTVVKSQLKLLYDGTITDEFKSRDVLSSLLVDGFDLEQIWQQLELRFKASIDKSLVNVAKLVSKQGELLFNELEDFKGSSESEDLECDDNTQNIISPEEEEETNDAEVDRNDEFLEENSDNTEPEEDDYSNEDGNEESQKVKGSKAKSKSSVVDDEFFKLNEMEAFLKHEEFKESNPNQENKKGNEDDDEDSESDEEEVDYFAETSGDEDGHDEENKNPKYEDFFVESEPEPRGRKRKILEDESGDSGVSEDEHPVKSTLEQREERLKRKIEHLESEALNEKPWHLKGEVTSENRPENSLLEKVLDFDMISRPAPVITEETTLKLEDIIRQRIKDKAFDSVERKAKPVETPLEYKKKLVLDQEKSKESLAQIYEKEYLQQKESLNPESADKDEEEPKEHKEIKLHMEKLFTQLDALSNFHFTPRPVAPELRVVSNLPAISMEEVAPVAATDASQLAPQEIKTKTKGDVIGESEKSSTDKKRERRKKKLKQRQHAKEKKNTEKLINKLNPGLGNKYSKEKVRNALKQLGVKEVKQ